MFLGGVPCIEKRRALTKLFYKVFSIGIETGQVTLIILLYQVGFEDMKDVLVVLRFILSSSNLQELQISNNGQ